MRWFQRRAETSCFGYLTHAVVELRHNILRGVVFHGNVNPLTAGDIYYTICSFFKRKFFMFFGKFRQLRPTRALERKRT